MTAPVRWRPALAILGSTAATIGAWLTLDLPYACLGALAMITCAAFAPSVIGATRIPPGAAHDPREVREWREAHPGATIGEAIAAVSGR